MSVVAIPLLTEGWNLVKWFQFLTQKTKSCSVTTQKKSPWQLYFYMVLFVFQLFLTKRNLNFCLILIYAISRRVKVLRLLHYLKCCPFLASRR